MAPRDLEPLKKTINQRSYNIFHQAHSFSSQRLLDCEEILDELLDEKGLDSGGVCFVAVGSVGRLEALRASDLDILPILREGFEWPLEVDREARDRLGQHFDVKISRGSKLTRATPLSDLTDAETIGGSQDSDALLTQRILVLCEGAKAGGDLKIEEVRRQVLDAYGSKERTSGRHVLSLCNDLARYYRQLCIDYKNKVDTEDKDWSTRNIKLRHSRKFWYFATLLAIAAQATKRAHGESDYRETLLEIFGKPPVRRLVDSLAESYRPAASPVLKSFAWFLAFMADEENRQALAQVKHENRYSPKLQNPFPALKHNSDVMHNAMIRLLDSLDTPTRHRVLDWFLL